jgi:hypothetical protein
MSTTTLKRSYNSAFFQHQDDGDALMSSPTSSSPQFIFTENGPVSTSTSTLSNFSFDTQQQNNKECRLFEQPLKRRRFAVKNGSSTQHEHQAENQSCALESLLAQHGTLPQRTMKSSNRPNHFPNVTELGKRKYSNCSHDGASCTNSYKLDDASSFINEYKLEKRRIKQNGSSATAVPKKKTFSEEEVKMILEVRDQQLREEYDGILQRLLQEQFNQFARFNQDYISRQFKSSDFSYTS